MKTDNAKNSHPPDTLTCDSGRVLVVDDERIVRQAFKAVIEFFLPGCRVDLAASGREALESFAALHQKAVIMDIVMPGMDGEMVYEELRRMCGDHHWQMPSLVFCSAFSPPPGVRQIISSNPADGLLEKPVRNEVLIQYVQKGLAA